MNRNRVILVRAADTKLEAHDQREEVKTVSGELNGPLRGRGSSRMPRIHSSNKQVWPSEFAMAPSRDFQEEPFFRGIYPAIFPLKVIGLYTAPPVSSSIKACRRLNPRLGYSLFILLVMGLYFCRSVATFSANLEFGEALFFKVQQSVWFFECFIKACVMCQAWRGKNKLPELFRRWTAVCGNIPPRKSVRRFSILASLAGSAFVVFNGFGISYVFFRVRDLEKIVQTVIEPLDSAPGQTAISVLVILILVLESAVAMFPVCLMSVLSYALYKEFKDIAQIVSTSVSKDEDFVENVDKIRSRHQQLCKLVAHLDSSFHVIVAFTYLSNIPNLCIVLYSVLYFRQHESMVALNVFWFCFLLIHIVTVSMFGAWLNAAAHSPLSDIYSVTDQSLSSHKQFEINMFLSKLNGESIGLSAMQMFVINRPTILTVGGLLLTYFALLVQFKNSTESCICKSPEVVNGSYHLT